MKTNRNQIKLSILAAALCAWGVQAQAQSFTEVVQNALVMYPGVKSAKFKTEAARADIGRARAAHMPQISYGLTNSRYSSGNLPSTIEANQSSPSMRLNLWSGGRIEADAQRAEALTLSSELQEAATQDDVASLAAEAYINWARAVEMTDLASKNLEAHRLILLDIQKIVSVDAGRRIDYDQAKIRLDNASLTLLQRQTDLAQARQRLSRFWTGSLGRQPKGLQDALSANGALGHMPKSMDQVISQVSDDLPQVAKQLAEVKAAERAVAMARGQYWPTVDVTASRQLNTAVFPYKQDTLTQVQLNMPLYSGGATSAAVKAAASQLEAAQSSLDEVRLVARERAVLAYEDWRSAQGRAVQGAEQTRVSEKVVEGYRQQFQLAKRQLLDLLNIQNESFNYQSASTAAFYDEQVSRTRLLASMGDLAKRFKQ
jgi:outer membrane protein, adhesin transport system